MTFTAAPQSIYVPSLNYDASNNIDIVYDTILPVDNYDAKATLDVSFEDVANAFYFSTTNLHLASGMDSLYDLHFYVSDPTANGGSYLYNTDVDRCVVDVSYIPTGNADPSKGLVDGEQVVSVDFIESLAYKMFGSAYYDTFFRNADALVTNISEDIFNAYRNISMESIKAVSRTVGTDADLEVDVSGNKYLDNRITSAKNIVRLIMATLYRNDPARFNIENGLVANTTDMQNIPLVVGDKLQFILTLKPSSTQTHASNPIQGGFPNGQDVTTLTRKYLIEFVLSN